ncbi:MAG: hypothetical protein VX075_06135 [Pseudomonadota bacterium]|nr:hypothetical protein [Pseudomonadota bacterium]
MAIAINILTGASSKRLPLSCAKKVKKGTLSPEWINTPAEASSKTAQTIQCPSPAAAEMMSDFETKPPVRGKAEIDNAPMMQKPADQGIDF